MEICILLKKFKLDLQFDLQFQSHKILWAHFNTIFS